MTRTHKSKKELILQIKSVIAKDTEQKLLNGFLVENFLSFKYLYLNLSFKYRWLLFLLFYFNSFKIPFHCLLASIVSLERSTNNLKADTVKVIVFFSPSLIALKIFFLVCGFQYLHLLCPLFCCFILFGIYLASKYVPIEVHHHI